MKAMKQEPDGELELGLAHYHAHRYALADEAFARALAKPDPPAWVRFRRARIAERSGRAEDALDELRQYYANGGSSPFASLLEAACHDRLRRDRARRGAMERAAALVERDPASLVAVPGVAPRGQEDALRRLRSAVSEHPSDVARRCLLAEQLLEAGEPEEAELHALSALAIAASPQAAALAGRAALAVGRGGEATCRLTAAVDRAARFADFLLWLGLSHFGIGALLDAQRAATASLAGNPAHGAAYRLLALVLFRSGDEARASLALRRGMARGREPHEARASVACASAGCGTMDDAAVLESAIARHPEYPDLKLALDRVLEAYGAGRRQTGTRMLQAAGL